MQKYGWEGFCLTYVEPKHKSDEHNQAGTNDFQCLIWIFLVCWLSPAWYNVDCSQLTSWLDHYQLQLVYPTMEHHPVRNLQHEISLTTSDIFNQSQPLLHITQIYFCVPIVFLPFLKRSENTSVIVRFFATPWTVACQALLSMEFSRPEYWGGYCSLLQGIFPTQRLNPGLPHCRQIRHHLSHQGSPFLK